MNNDSKRRRWLGIGVGLFVGGVALMLLAAMDGLSAGYSFDVQVLPGYLFVMGATLSAVGSGVAAASAQKP